MAGFQWVNRLSLLIADSRAVVKYLEHIHGKVFFSSRSTCSLGYNVGI